jgi:5-methylcytosine-specific restriction endonuclease McrA
VGLQKKRDSMGRRRSQTRDGDVVNLDELYRRDHGLCHVCYLLVDEHNWHLDHVVPLSRGGKHVWDNMAVSHPGCNLWKGTKILSGIPGVLEMALRACGLAA